ncbi:hypothetical protein BGZ97_001975 [Linnemannia gamsii]|uniref:Uncharacterized protein n=1 Tax=Linnemannia gamsii TaxID=64522 RepID=A0A9P6UIX0_9FUNG|nr:hypothetical protein BGZ97_001975 [Linnemannia gamsii]
MALFPGVCATWRRAIIKIFDQVELKRHWNVREVLNKTNLQATVISTLQAFGFFRLLNMDHCQWNLILQNIMFASLEDVRIESSWPADGAVTGHRGSPPAAMVAKSLEITSCRV